MVTKLGEEMTNINLDRKTTDYIELCLKKYDLMMMQQISENLFSLEKTYNNTLWVRLKHKIFKKIKKQG